MRDYRGAIAVGLFLFFGTLVSTRAEPDRRNEKDAKPEKREERTERGARTQQSHEQKQQHQNARSPQSAPAQPRVHESRPPEPKRQSGRPAQQTRRAPQPPPMRQVRPPVTEQQAISWQQQRGWMRQGGLRSVNTWQQARAGTWASEHRSWAQRGGYGGYSIPPSRFVLAFGSQHGFRMRARPSMYMGYPRFWYAGYAFLMVDPWPEYWAEDWYESDDLYIAEDDGYYLHNRRDPSIRLAITITL